MIVAIKASLWLAGGLAVVWIARLLYLKKARRMRIVLRHADAPYAAADAPRVSVIVAAKDEQDCIENCLTSLLGQDYPNLEVIAVDDRSTDDTPSILSQLAQRWPDKLRVLTITRLRDGWFGKNNAMRTGIEASTGKWLLLTDADCVHTCKSTISIALQDAVENKVDFLSITPQLIMEKVWEKVLQPVCALVLIFWFMPGRVNDPRKSTAYANGAFMLLRRSCYDAIGGHEVVRTEVNEDVHLARLAKSSGHRLRVVENRGLYTVRMYRTPGEAWRGWSRIYYGCLGSLSKLMLVAGFMVVFSLAPWAGLLVSAAAWAATGFETASDWPAALAAWAGVIMLQQIVMTRSYRILRIPRLWALTYPIGACITLAILVVAMLKCLGASTTTWRGTTYRGHQRIPDPVESEPRLQPEAVQTSRSAESAPHG